MRSRDGQGLRFARAPRGILSSGEYSPCDLAFARRFAGAAA
jgi:hypothetical protein